MEGDLSRLGPEIFGCASLDPVADLRDFENEFGFRLPETLASFLVTMRGAVVFARGAKFAPMQLTGLEDRQGLLGLGALYGLGSGDCSLKANNARYRDQIPGALVTIGDSPGGNQICIGRDDGRVYFWNHESISDSDSTFLVADNFATFLDKLAPDDAPPGNAPKIVESESFLDF